MSDYIIYPATALTGGQDYALDGYDGAVLNDKDMAIVITATAFYHYILDADSGAVESSPDVIKPDDNAGTKRWILIGVGGSPAPTAHHDSHDPEDGSDALDCAAPSELASVQAAGEGSAHTFARADHAHQIQHSIADNHLVTVDGTTNQPVDTDYAKFTASGLEGKDKAGILSDLNVEDGADITDAVNIASSIVGVVDKATPVDADSIALIDSAAASVLKETTWSNIKATLKTYFDTLYNKYVHPNHSGEVTSAADGATTIADAAVTLAKMANMATASILGRNTVAVGVPEVLAKATVLSILNVDDGADVTGSNVPQAHKDSHDPQDGSDKLDTAAPSELAGVQAAGVGTSHSLARADHTHQIQHGIADNHLLTVDQADAATGEFAKFTASGIESRSKAELLSDINVEDGADKVATVGIVVDVTPQLGGDLDMNAKGIDFPSTANITDCKDEDDMASNSATMLATQQSIKAYVLANSSATSYVKVSDTQAATVEGGTFTQDAWRTRVLNTEDSDTDAICSLSSNQITLAAGTYECRISAPALLVSQHKLLLYNVTGSTNLLIGTAEYAGTATAIANRSFISGKFTIAASQAIEVRHRCSLTRNTNGFGSANSFGISEVYTIAEFWKVA